MTGKVGGVSRDVGVDEHVEGRVTGRETRRQTAGGQAAEGQMARGGRWAALLLPRAGLKRWLAVTLAGVALTGLGIGIGLRYLLASLEAPQWERLLTLGFLPDWLRGVLLLTGGLAVAIAGLINFNRALVKQLLPADQRPGRRAVLDALLAGAGERPVEKRPEGPRIVAIGGGTGMPQLLRGLRQYTNHITAIVTVADDGGSSGRLRRQMGTLPPGDFRNNIAALSEAEGLMSRLFQYRFARGEVGETSELAGHSFGNLFITTMGAISGSFEQGLADSSKVLSVRGRVLPSTLENVVLCAEVSRVRADGEVEWVQVVGESQLPEAGGRIERVFLRPEETRAYPEAIRAILQADLIVAGPGSFYTSILPNLLVKGIKEAICASQAPALYICNVATQPGETDDYSVGDHMRHLRRHAGDAFLHVLANTTFAPPVLPSSVSHWVAAPAPGETLDYRLFTGDLIDRRRPWRHDPEKVARRVMEVFEEMEREKAGELGDK